MITVALAKGALLRDSVARFQAAGLDFRTLLEPDNRLLMVPSACGRARALLVRNADPKQASFASLPGRLVRGENMVGVVARNRAGGAGLLLQIEFTGPGLRTNWISDTSWLTSAQAVSGWATNPPAGGGVACADQRCVPRSPPSRS